MSYRFLSLILVCILATNTLRSQNRQIDSLQNEIKLAKHDTTKIRLYNDLGIAFSMLDFDKSLNAANQAIAIADTIGYKKQLYRSYYAIAAACFYIHRDFNKTYEYSKKSYHAALQFDFYDGIVKSITNMSICYMSGVQISDKELESYFNTLIKLSKKNTVNNNFYYSFISVYEKRLSSTDYFDIVGFLEKKSITDDKQILAIYHYLKSRDYFDKNKYFYAIESVNNMFKNTDNQALTVSAKSELINIYMTLGKYKEAERQCLDLLSGHNEKKDLILNAIMRVSIEKQLATIYMNQKQFQKAYELQKDKLKLVETDPNNKNELLYDIAFTYHGLDSIDKANYYTDYSIRFSDSIKNYNTLSNALSLKIKILNKQNDNTNVQYYIQKLKSLNLDSLRISNQLDAYQVLNDYYKKNEDYQNSLLYAEKLLQVQDSINSVNVRNLIEENEVKYEVEKKNLQLASQEQTIKGRNLLLGISAALILMVITLLIVIVRFQRKKRKMEEQKQQSLENELKLRTLQSKVLPHFTKNVLTAIGHFAMEDNRKAGKYISLFSRFSQLTLSNSDKNYNTLEEEMKYIQIYLELEKMRHGNKIDFTIHTREGVDNQISIPAMTLYTYCDNAIRHGLVNSEGYGLLEISVGRNNEGTTISVRDNGIGRKRSAELGTHGNQIGLKLIQQQVDFYNTQNERKIKQEITDLHDHEGKAAGTLVELYIPDGYVFSSN